MNLLMYFVRNRIKLLRVRKHRWCHNVQCVWFFSFDSLQLCGAILANVSVRTDLWPIYLSAWACLFRWWNTERQNTQLNVLSVSIQIRVIETACHEIPTCMVVRSSEYLSMSPLCNTFQWNVYFQIMPGVRCSSGPKTTPSTLSFCLWRGSLFLQWKCQFEVLLKVGIYLPGYTASYMENRNPYVAFRSSHPKQGTKWW